MGIDDANLDEHDGNAKGYALSGKIMLSAIVVLFFVVILMVCLHLYARWFLLRARRRNRRRQNHRRPHLVFYVDPAASAVASRGLDSALLSSLPVFAYSSKTHPECVECAVCLSEFEEGETGRVLPKCNHSFHTDCIDMWFKTHSTCPLCRAPVEPEPAGENRPEVVITVCEPGGTEPGSSSGLCAECEHGGEEGNRTGHTVSSSSSSSSIGPKQKASSLVGVTVEVPRRSEIFGDESSCESPSTQSSFRSPMSRMLSFKRMLSRDRKGNLSPSSGSTSELEKGGRDETHGDRHGAKRVRNPSGSNPRITLNAMADVIEFPRVVIRCFLGCQLGLYTRPHHPLRRIPTRAHIVILLSDTSLVIGVPDESHVTLGVKDGIDITVHNHGLRELLPRPSQVDLGLAASHRRGAEVGVGDEPAALEDEGGGAVDLLFAAGGHDHFLAGEWPADYECAVLEDGFGVAEDEVDGSPYGDVAVELPVRVRVEGVLHSVHVASE
ncbi:RING-H2 finger protein ATL2 [Senna tora]|uniref:RING-type E3 ubiquitin transferase n=1 Tax=Senna tora TaxID=362788 RepID=A0A834WXE0_9FABA|nr:RING-H2 finger protein ATL2 [Senna tora]